MKIGILLGSGYGDFINSINVRKKYNYEDIKGLVSTTVKGHKGIFYEGEAFDNEWLVAEGRLHFYEGHDVKRIGRLVRYFKEKDCKLLILTTATGGINRSFKVGDLVLINDFIDFFPIAWNFRIKQPLLSEKYMEIVRRVTLENNLNVKEGTFAGVTGPTYETPAEVRVLEFLGADLISMSVIPEVYYANKLKLQVICFGIITNHLVHKNSAELTHLEVLDVVKKSTNKLVQLLSIASITIK
ncbi:MAG: purine-nucleoside phosphorylase [Candidatus Coatesbacteria bacterium]|nr:purine-nucleoside phosphorylase [Candidatus Coatesbacteria bacterium]